LGSQPARISPVPTSIYQVPIWEDVLARPRLPRGYENSRTPLVSELGPPHPRHQRLAPNRTHGPLAAARFDVTDPIGRCRDDGGSDRPLIDPEPGRRRPRCADASDHAWLWNRGYEGGGPQLKLLRRSGPLDDEKNQAGRKRRWTANAMARPCASPAVPLADENSSCHHHQSDAARAACPDTHIQPGDLSSSRFSKAVYEGPRDWLLPA